MRYFPVVLLSLIILNACDGNRQNQQDADPLTAEDGSPEYKDYEVDSLTIRIDESTDQLDQEIKVVQDDVDSLLEGI